MKKAMNLKSLLFCAMLVFALAVNTVSVQANALDYLGNTIDESVLTNELESVGTYQSVARSTYLHEGYVSNTVKLNVYLERSSGPEDFYSYKKWEKVDYNTNSLYFSTQIKVEKGYYYRLRGYHSCTKNGVTENGGSRTNGIYIG